KKYRKICHCERSEAIPLLQQKLLGLLRRSAPRNDKMRNSFLEMCQSTRKYTIKVTILDNQSRTRWNYVFYTMYWKTWHNNREGT
ncbi:MAG: hypothetical protein ABRQ39_21505, partial [Candidatus Eremiobacterota bacterium]